MHGYIYNKINTIKRIKRIIIIGFREESEHKTSIFKEKIPKNLTGCLHITYINDKRYP